MARRRKYGVSFSLNRALGISSAKQRFARMTGIPTTRSGMEHKIGRMATSSCQVYVVLPVVLLVAVLLTFSA